MSIHSIKLLIASYKNLLLKDGIISKEEIIEMLRLEIDVPEFNVEENIIKVADKILQSIEIKKDSVMSEMKERLKERMELYNQGLSDVEIAEIQKVNPITIWQWRDTKGLKAHKGCESVKKERMELYNQGLTDKEIAIKLREVTSTIRVWRERQGLKPNKKTTPKTECIKDKRLRLYNEGWTYQQIADDEGVKKRSVQDWFYRHGINKDKSRL